MAQSKFKHIYGPVYSWRMGMSLGIDPISTNSRICNYNCTYCQLGQAVGAVCTGERRIFIATGDIVTEIKTLDTGVAIDHLTFSGNGEPTLALNLGEMLRAVRAVRPEKTAVITNGTLLGRGDVQADLAGADLVLVKLDAADEAVFQAVNRPAPGLTLKGVVAGIKAFRHTFKGRFALQMMLIGKNKEQAPGMARLAREIGADEVQLNTPLRPNPEKPLTPAEMASIKTCFAGLHVRSIYEEEQKPYHPIDLQATERRHGIIV